MGPKREREWRGMKDCLPEPVNPRQPESAPDFAIGRRIIVSISHVVGMWDGFASMGLPSF